MPGRRGAAEREFRASPSQEPIVHIIDDDESIRSALESLLRSVGLAVRTYPAIRDFINASDTELRGCLVLDVRLPGLSGLDFQAQLTSFNIYLPAIIMTGHGDIPMSVQAMKAGAVDFLPKPFRDQDMLDAVATAMERDRIRRERQADADDLVTRFNSLSDREKQVMSRVASGLMNKQVAFELGLSEITIKIHRGSAMRKMGARSLAELVRMSERLKSQNTVIWPE